MKYYFAVGMMLISMFCSSNLFAWEVNTHRAIDRCAISKDCSSDGRERAKNLHHFVRSTQDFVKGVKNGLDNESYKYQIFGDYKLKDGSQATYFSYITDKNVGNWGQEFSADYDYNDLIEAGTILEDSFYVGSNVTGADGRFNNHFYDPQHNGAALSDGYGGNANALRWATKRDLVIGNIFKEKNDYNYPKAYDYFLSGFTEKDIDARRAFRAKMFVSLGFLLHLLNDMNVPAHTRDNSHPWDDYLERWARGGIAPGNDTDGFRITGRELSPNNDRNKFISIALDNRAPVKGEFSDNFYTKEADFTGVNFFSAGPDKDCSTIGHAIASNCGGLFKGIVTNKGSILKDGYKPTTGSGAFVPERNGYITSYNSELGNHNKLAIRKSSCRFCWISDVLITDGDNSVLEDNAVNLIPRAVANAEGFINYFFRGQMLATIENGQLKIINASDENLVSSPDIVTFKKGGAFTVYIDKPDGTRTPWLSLSGESAVDLPANGIRTLNLPKELQNLSDEDAKKLTVVFDGKIGNERGISATTVDPKRDFDEDGMPDFWEVEHHLNINKDDSALDLDGDGVSNLDEYKAGTDPSVKEIPILLKATPGDGKVTFSWNTVPGLAYRLCHATESITDINKCMTYAGGDWWEPILITPFELTALSNGQPLKNGATYYFRLVSVNASGKQSPASNEVIATPNKASINDFTNLDPEVKDSTLNVGIDTTDGTLKLSFKDDGSTNQTFPYIWIANSGEGTISKLDVKTGQELGRYRTGPGTDNGNPSRTTVDQDGNVWVGNRNNNTITKVGLLEFGQCIDRNKNGKIDTSTGGTDVKSWGGYFGDGQGITYAEDECVLQHVNLTAEGVSTPADIRMLAIDKDNNVFAGGHYVSSIFKVNGTTGAIIDAKDTVGSFYGGLVDKNGTVWAASRGTGYGSVIKISNDLKNQDLINAGLNVYGIALNKYDEIWVTDPYSPSFASFNINDPTSTLTIYSQENRGYQSCYAQGIAVDDKDNIFIAGCSGAYDQAVGHYKRIFDGTTHSVQYVNNYTVGGGATGVAVDGFGHIWSSNLTTNSVSRIILPTETTPVKIDTYPVGYQPYNYSDMTGRVVRTITSRQGTWEAIFDSKVEGYNWQQVRWRLKTALPAGTGVQVYAKTAPSSLELNAKPYIEVQNGVDVPNLEAGRYLKLKVRLTSNNLTDTPEVVEIQLY